MKIKEIRDLSLSEMKDKLNETQEAIFNLRFQNAVGQLENPKKIMYYRKDIARLKTVIRQQENQATE